MPKLKTHKSISKRYRVTKKDKVMQKKAGQGHFNARESGNTTRAKRKMISISRRNVRTIKNYMPY